MTAAAREIHRQPARWVMMMVPVASLRGIAPGGMSHSRWKGGL
jgi:hypothetical protein